MNFKYKSYLQTLFSNMPKGEVVNYWFQKNITKSLPVKDHSFQEKLNDNAKHLEHFKKYVNQDPKESTYYEFGAGWDLIAPTYFSSCGFKELHVIDIRKLIFPELIQHTLNKIFPDSQMKDVDKKMLERFRIYYNAPMDARNTTYDNQSMDFIISNVTFEHIPKKDILPILKECHRLLKPSGIFSSRIDYNDHWSGHDKSITPYNYMRYSEKEWRKYSPSLHYQNRLRHIDYMTMYEQAGFEILEVKTKIPADGMNKLKTVPLHDDFKHYTLDELAIGGSEIVAKRR